MEVKVPSSDSIFADLGVTAKAKSRFISSLDRLAGSVPDMLTAKFEGYARKKRAKTDVEVDAIKASGAAYTSGIQLDDPYVQAVLEDVLDKALKQHAKKHLVLVDAAKQLKSSPPSDEEANKGPDQLSESFLNRFESYVENATEEELKAKWAKILAAEIKNPNLFSPKVMRMVDELEPDVAVLFENICKSRVDDVILKCLIGELTFEQINVLVAADLIVDPGMGQVRFFQSTIDSANKNILFFSSHPMAIFIEGVVDAPQPFSTGETAPIIETKWDGNEFGAPIYKLTQEGAKIASILPNNLHEVFHNYAEILATSLLLAVIRVGGVKKMVFLNLKCGKMANAIRSRTQNIFKIFMLRNNGGR